MIKNIIILCLILIIIYLCADKFSKFYKNISKEYYESKLLDIKVDLSKIKKEQLEIQNAIEENLNTTVEDKKLREILFYVLSNGKKVRPIIFTSIYKKINNQENIPKHIMNCALAVEYIHTASLIIDDIMDDDDDRRGKQALHIKYNLSIAQLAAILLFSLGINNIQWGLDELIKNHSDANKDIFLITGKMYSNILQELTLGQYYDITTPSYLFTDKIKGIENVIHKKTSSLFEYSFIMPCILSNYNKSTEELENKIKIMKKISEYFGLIFQIADDFEDYLQDQEKNGEKTSNFVIQLGFYDAHQKYNNIIKEFNIAAEKENIMTNEITEIINYLNIKVETYYNHYKKIEF
ncbi:polyprenyl synthetase [Indivirus ILV1]|uniref:Trans-prenyltransferase n=1 Tax=Indivirus ILV1 TaxID=1977633 RepID=A0A1V0SE37_9VIRU|nr:polyprenyl synthetase [Indivirus ILV1]